MRPVDEWLVSEETGEGFRHCVSCRWPLLEIDSPWLVNKDYFRGECVLEYAVCQKCRDQVAARISEESKAGVRKFLESAIDWQARLAEFMAAPDCDRFSRCIACQVTRENLEGFAISAFFDAGGSLVTGPLPLLICRDCIGRMTAHLSAQSRAVWAEFLDRHFEGPHSGREGWGLL